MAMNEVHQPVRQVPRKIRTEIRRPVLAQPTRHINPRIFLARQLDVGIRFVVAKQNVVARLPLLDQVVLERQRFLLVIDLDKVDVARLVDQRAGFRSPPAGRH